MRFAGPKGSSRGERGERAGYARRRRNSKGRVPIAADIAAHAGQGLSLVHRVTQQIVGIGRVEQGGEEIREGGH